MFLKTIRKLVQDSVPTTFLHNVVASFLFLLFVFVPFIPYLTFGPNANVFAVLMVSLGLFCSSIILLLRPTLMSTRLRSVVWFGLVALGFLLLLSIRNGFSLTEATGFGFLPSSFVSLVSLFNAVIVGYVYAQERGDVEKLARFWVIGAGVFGILNIVFSLFGVSLAVPHTNASFGMLLLFGIGFILATALGILGNLPKKEMAALFVAEILFAVYIYASNSQLLMYTSAGVAIVLTIALVKKRALTEVRKPQNMIIMLLSGILLFGAIVAPHFGHSVLSGYLGIPKQEVRPSFSTTLTVVQDVYTEKVEVPLIGTGVHSFGEVWNGYMPEAVLRTDFWNEDFASGSSFLSTLIVEIGIPMTLGLIILVIPVFFFLFVQSTKPWPRALAGVVVFGFIWSVFFGPPTSFLLLVGVCAGLLMASFDGEKEDSQDLKNANYFQTLTLFLVSVVWVSISVVHFAAIHQYGLGIERFQKEKPEYSNAAEHFKRSLEYMQLPETLRTLSYAYLERAKERLEKDSSEKSLEQVEEFVDLSIEVAEQAIFINDKDYRTQLALAEAQLFKAVLLQDIVLTETSALTFGNAHDLGKKRISPMFGMARAYFILGKKERTLEFLNQILVLRPQYAPATEMLKVLRSEQ